MPVLPSPRRYLKLRARRKPALTHAVLTTGRWTPLILRPEAKRLAWGWGWRQLVTILVLFVAFLFVGWGREGFVGLCAGWGTWRVLDIEYEIAQKKKRKS